MKIFLFIFTILTVIGFSLGVILMMLNKLSIAGVVWAVTALISFIAYDINRSKNKN